MLVKSESLLTASSLICWELIFVTFLKCKLRYFGFFFTDVFITCLLSAAFNLAEVLKFRLGCSTGQSEGKALDWSCHLKNCFLYLCKVANLSSTAD